MTNTTDETRRLVGKVRLVKHAKKFETDRGATHGFAVHPKRFVFFDRKTGTRRFEVKASQDGSMPMDQAVSLLAIHCVARQQMPRDFSVMIGVGEDLVAGLVGLATKLIGSCTDTRAPVPLSRRQYEVLNAVAQNLSNKEIAGRLNVSVRTIKFHVSSLLEKFDVRGRVDLMLEATGALSPEGLHDREGNALSGPLPEVKVAPMLFGTGGKPRQLIPWDRRSGSR
jgi:DNA-binding CsgD family transcriptional regulator